MNSTKMIGLAALSALMATAFVGASLAMAESTQLCKADENPCSAENVITHVHEETLTGNKAKLLNSLGTVECKALFLGDALGLAAPLVIHGKFTYTECKRGSETCTVTEKSTDTLLQVLKEGHETSKVTGEGEVTVKCGFFINCTYNDEGLQGTSKGPLLASSENGEVTISEQTLSKVSGLCPETGKLDIATIPLEETYFGGPGGNKMLCDYVGVGKGHFKVRMNNGECLEEVETGTIDSKYDLITHP